MDIGFSLAELNALLQVVLVDLVMAGDNAIVIGLAAAGLPPGQRRRVIVAGIAAAAVLRIGFATVTVQLLEIIGLMLAGGLLLLWVCWKLWRELREGGAEKEQEAALEVEADLGVGPPSPEVTPGGSDRARRAHAPREKTLGQAVLQIVVADLSMSLDNVLAVAGVAHEHPWVLVFGLALSVAFTGLAAGLIVRLLERHRWLAYVGLFVIFYAALAMIAKGGLDVYFASLGP